MQGRYIDFRITDARDTKKNYSSSASKYLDEWGIAEVRYMGMRTLNGDVIKPKEGDQVLVEAQISPGPLHCPPATLTVPPAQGEYPCEHCSAIG